MIIVPFSDMLAADSFKKIRACLHANGVLVYPTDTLYGLGGNFYSPAVMEKIDCLKNRRDLPYSAAAGTLSMLESLAKNIPEVFHSKYRNLLPGKFTFLFAANPAIEPRLLKNSVKIGIRLPGLPSLLQLIEKLGMPLVSTSVNRSGQPPLNDPARIAREFPEIDLLIDGGILPPSLGSTLIDVTVTPPMIVRRGDDWEKLASIPEDAFR